MASYKYAFGNATKIEQLFPPPKYADPSLNFHDYTDVIRHYTQNSLKADGIDFREVEVTRSGGK